MKKKVKNSFGISSTFLEGNQDARMFKKKRVIIKFLSGSSECRTEEFKIFSNNANTVEKL